MRQRSLTISRHAWFVILLVLASTATSPTNGQEAVSLISRGDDAVFADGPSTNPRTNRDGTVVVFQSEAPDITVGDGDRLSDVFLRIVPVNRTILISQDATTEAKGDGNSVNPSIDGPGSNIVYASDANNLSGSDNNDFRDIYYWTSEVAPPFPTILISRAADSSIAADGVSDDPEISADGDWVAFKSTATNLVRDRDIVDPLSLIYVHPLTDPFGVGRAELVSPPVGDPANADCVDPDISGDGNFVVFSSKADNLVEGDTNGVSDVFLVDRRLGTIERISRGTRRSQANGPSSNPRISDDSRYVAFDSNATNLVGRDTNDATDVFRFDRLTAKIKRVTFTESGEQIPASPERGSVMTNDISEDGRFVAFDLGATITFAENNRLRDVHVRDCLLERTILASITRGGAAGNGDSRRGSLCADGSCVVFDTSASNLLIGSPIGIADTNEVDDVYLRTSLPLAGVPEAEMAHNAILFCAENSLVGAISLDGVVRDGGLLLEPPGRRFAVDERNILWILDIDGTIQRVEASTFGSLDPEQFPPIQIGADNYLDFVAGGGAAWVAGANGVFRVDSSGITAAHEIEIAADSVAMALDPSGRLWIASWSAERGLTTVVKARGDLTPPRRIRYANSEFKEIEQIAFDSRGQLYLRTPEFLCSLSPSGGVLWCRNVPGDGLAVSGNGEIYTASGDFILCFNPKGEVRLREPLRFIEPADIVLDGLGRPWIMMEGVSRLFRFDPETRRTDTFPIGTRLKDQLHSRWTPYAAMVASPDFDSDGDGFLNGVEARSGFNPFDATSPAAKVALLPVIDARATVVDQSSVRLQWTSPIVYERFYVFRDGQLIDGAPFPFSAGRDGVIDANVRGGGTRTYKIVGQGIGGAKLLGQGGGFPEPGVELPASPEVTVSVTLGEGELIGCVDFEQLEPTAVAYNRDTDEVTVAFAGGDLVTFPFQDPNDLDAQSLILRTLPAAFANPDSEIRGMTYDPADPSALFLLIPDGTVFRAQDENDPIFAFELPATPVAAGYYGLGSVDGEFFSFVGPGVDCFIGYRPDDASSRDIPLSTVLGLIDDAGAPLIAHAAGIDSFDEQTLVVGIGPEGTDTVSVAMRLTEELTGANSNVQVDALGSTFISDLAFAPSPSVGPPQLLVIDRTNSRLCFHTANFPESPVVNDMSPSNGPWDGPSQTVTLAGENFAGDTWVSFDGLFIEAQITNDSISFEAPQLNADRSVPIGINSSSGPAIAPLYYTYGIQRPDSNNDRSVDISDPIFVLSFLFEAFAEAPPCEDAADANDDGSVDIADPIFVLNFLFNNGETPPAPYSEDGSTFGLDSTFDVLPPCQAQE